ncbi:MAG: biotin/lipoyl-containing protein [Candidatus Aminicenantales bacterium]
MSFTDFDFLVDGEPRRVSLESRDGTLAVREAGLIFETEVRRISANEILFRFGDRTVRIHLVRDGERTYVAVDGRGFVVSEYRPDSGSPGEGDEKTAAAGLQVKSPMPGKVTMVAVSEGDAVRKNQTLVVVEAMKMENEIKTAIDGFVTKIHVAVGDLVDSEMPLVEVERKSPSL